MEQVISLLIGYIIGSFPTAYVILKKKDGVDITQSGSGNVGALNSYEVSKSKLTGLVVLLIDAAKGAAAVFVVQLIFGESFLIGIISLTGAVFAHCYSPWIKFKGGRGLATAAGGALLLSIPVLILWGLIWLIAFVFRKNVHFANFSATLLSILLSFSSAKVLVKYTSPAPDSELQFSLFVSIMLIIILSRHIKPIKDYFNSRNKKIEDTKDESI